MEDQLSVAQVCSLPPELDEIDLIAAIDGEASIEVMNHLYICSYCAARAHEFANLQGLLRKHLFRMFCPTSDELTAYHQGMLDHSRYDLITTHLAECPHCTHEMQLLEQILPPPRHPPSPNPWPSPTSIATLSPPRTFRRIIAKIVTISTTHALAGTLRGPKAPQQYAYNAEDFHLRLQIQPCSRRPSRRIIQGTLDLENSTVHVHAIAKLFQLHQLVRTTELTEFGNFLFDDVLPGTYRLALALKQDEIIVETLRF